MTLIRHSLLVSALLGALAVLTLAVPAHAQGARERKEMEERMKDIARLMRESEQLLHEMTTIDKVVEKQQAILEELRKLQQNTPPQEAAQKAQQRKKDKLKEKQEETQQRIKKLFEDQASASDESVQELVRLLRSLPSQAGQGGGKPDPNNKKQRRRDREREKRLQEKKNKQQNMSPREKREHEKKQQAEMERRKAEAEAARLARLEAWIQRLPPKIQDRINRNDLSAIPLRYRRLVQQYTEARAKREAERDPSGDGDR